MACSQKILEGTKISHERVEVGDRKESVVLTSRPWERRGEGRQDLGSGLDIGPWRVTAKKTSCVPLH